MVDLEARKIVGVGSTRPWRPPVRVRRAVMLHRWWDLSFVHLPFHPDAVRALLPEALDVDVHDDLAWVGLIPFRLSIRAPGTPVVPWVTTFQETNVRTYVRGPDGRPGIWFFSLDASRLGAVLVSRLWYRLPYVWSRMRLSRSGRLIRYESRRRWPELRGVRNRLVLRIDEPCPPESLSDLERFLIARWWLYSTAGRDGRLAITAVEHEPWPIERATVLHVDDELFAAAGLGPPAGPAIAHHSRGVRVRFDRRRAAGSRDGP
jgi:uncharacterized protein